MAVRALRRRCCLLYREPLAAARAHTQEAAYLTGIDHREWNPGDLALHLTEAAPWLAAVVLTRGPRNGQICRGD